MANIKIRNTETGEIHDVSLSWILEEINRDRSEEWAPYDKTDWQEGMREFTEYEEYNGGIKWTR